MLRGLVLWLLALWAVAAINPFDRRDWLLENLLVFFCAALLLVSSRRFRFSNLSYVLLTVFLSLHLVGAHYTYAETPLGFWLRDWLDLGRNHYDRVVHFSFGLLLARPCHEVLVRRGRIRSGWSHLLTVSVVLSLSALYEVLEAVVAMIVSPELGAAWLGTQGDEWDAQRDTSLALLGAAMTMAWLAWRERTDAREKG
ncbi:MAG: hypothetical protein BWK76_19030 [Desulfobulbaceae bacterium A2]|nr:MAG: hypothetical protein BWK76_19030 [Desulfobulbaceae bacterium A2]